MDINKNQIYNLMEELINFKNKEIKETVSGLFEKAWELEGNAIGQIGESFVKEIFKQKNALTKVNQKTIHDEYDLLYKNNKIEIKTAKLGIKNNNFQFNGINPKYNYDLIILLGLEPDTIKYRIIKKDQIFYDHKKRSDKVKYELNGKQKERKLVPMNPENHVNKKLTLSTNELYDDIDNMFSNIEKLLHLKNM